METKKVLAEIATISLECHVLRSQSFSIYIYITILLLWIQFSTFLCLNTGILGQT